MIKVKNILRHLTFSHWKNFKSLRVCLLFCIVFWSTANYTNAQDTENLIRNGSFEKADLNKKKMSDAGLGASQKTETWVENWTVTPSAGEKEWIRMELCENAPDGKYVLHGMTEKGIYVYSGDKFSSSKTFNWSLQARSDNPSSSILQVSVFEYNVIDPLTKKKAFKRTKSIQKIPLTSKWQSFHGVIQPNQSSETVERMFALSMSGDVSVDNVRLEQAEQKSDLKRLFYLSFEDSLNAATESKKAEAIVQGEIPFVPGKAGRGALFRGASHLEFKAEEHFDQNEGTLALWVKPLTDFDDAKPHCLVEVPVEPYRFLDAGFVFTKGATEQIAPYMFYTINGPPWRAVAFDGKLIWKKEKWVHLLATWSQKEGIIRFYANGKLLSEDVRPFEKRPGSAGRVLCIGSRLGGTSAVPDDSWNDRMGNIQRDIPKAGGYGAEAVLDEIQIFDRMVNDDEAWLLAGNTGKAPAENGIRPLSPIPVTALPHELITPHVPFGKPLFQASPKALFIIYPQVARDVVELWQRMNMDYEVFFLSRGGKTKPFELSEHTQKYYYGTANEDRLKDIMEKLSRNPEVLVIADLSMDKVPPTVRERIFRMVNAGMGLVLINQEKPGNDYMKSKIPDETQVWLRCGIPWSGLPELFADVPDSQKKIAERCIETNRLGRGRVVMVRFREMPFPGESGLVPSLFDTGYSREWDYRYTHYLSMIGRVICWASGRDSALRIIFPPDGLSFERNKLPLDDAFQVSIEGQIPAKATLISEIRDPMGSPEWQGRTELKDKDISLALPLLKTGLHYLSMRLEAEGKTCDWGAVTFRVEAKNGIENIILDSDSVERGGTLHGKVQLLGPAGGGTTMTVRAVDTVGRIYYREQLKTAENEKEISFAIPMKDPETIMSYIEAELCQGGNVVSASSTQVFVPRRNMSALEAQEFPALLWWNISPYSSCGMIHARQMRLIGFNIALFWPREKGARNIAAWDFTTTAYMSALKMNADKKGWTVTPSPDITDGSWANPAVKEKLWRNVEAHIGDLRKYGPFFYSLGDENRYRGEMGFSPYGIKAYHEMQEKKYGSIERLNQEWGTKYTSFDEVPRLTPGQARTMKNGPALIDHRETNETVWRGMHEHLREKILEYDSFAKVGAEGSQAQNLEAMMDAMDIWAAYRDPRGDVLARSLHKPGNAAGHWFGAYCSGDQIPKAGMTQLWEQLFSGFANMAFYFAASPGGFESLLMADGSFAPFFMTQIEDWGRIVNGVGQLLRIAKPHMDGIAIHWSQGSRILAELGDNIENPVLVESQLIPVFRKCLLPGWQYITRKQLETKASELDSVRILFLPASTCISAKEAETLTNFVRNGGRLVSIGIPGKRNEYGRYLDKGPLDSLIGISRNADKKIQDGQGLTWKKMDALTKGPVEGVDYTVGLTDGEALASLGSIPLVIRKAFGKGESLCLNFDITRCDANAVSGFLENLIKDAGVKIFAHFAPGKGPDRFGILQSGKLLLLGAIQDHREGEWNGGTIHLQRAYHVYDVLHQKYLGKTDCIETQGKTDGQSACLFALQDEPVDRIELNMPEKLMQGDALTLTSRVLLSNRLSPDGRVIAIHVKGPDGAIRQHYRRMIYTHGDSAGQANLRFAYNDMSGTWTVSAIDVASGKSVQQSIQLEPLK